MIANKRKPAPPKKNKKKEKTPPPPPPSRPPTPIPQPPPLPELAPPIKRKRTPRTPRETNTPPGWARDILSEVASLRTQIEKPVVVVEQQQPIKTVSEIKPVPAPLTLPSNPPSVAPPPQDTALPTQTWEVPEPLTGSDNATRAETVINPDPLVPISLPPPLDPRQPLPDQSPYIPNNSVSSPPHTKIEGLFGVPSEDERRAYYYNAIIGS